MTRCKECGQFSRGPLCGTHLELKEEARLRAIANAALTEKARENERLRSEIAAQKRYQVHTTSVWRELTWTEAVATAERLYSEGIHFLKITDERGTTIRTWARDPETKLKVIA